MSLQEANLIGADLREANLRNADLNEAYRPEGLEGYKISKEGYIINKKRRKEDERKVKRKRIGRKKSMKRF